MSRRDCLNRLALGIGGIALADLLARDATAAPALSPSSANDLPHFAAKAKRIIYLFQSGGPSQLDLYDHKPLLNARHGEQLPDSIRGSQRLTGMSGNQSSIPIAGSPFKFSRYGQSGAWISDLLPHTAKIADDLCVIRSMHTEAINHGPGVTFMQTGSQIPGRPSFGSWLDYGLGSANANLPSFVVLITKGKTGQPLMSHLWGAGFLPAKHQGVRFRSGADPVLYLGNPAGVSPENRRLALDRLRELHEHEEGRLRDQVVLEFDQVGGVDVAAAQRLDRPHRAREPEPPGDGRERIPEGLLRHGRSCEMARHPDSPHLWAGSRWAPRASLRLKPCFTLVPCHASCSPPPRSA
jgi:hypothetical protein